MICETNSTLRRLRSVARALLMAALSVAITFSSGAFSLAAEEDARKDATGGVRNGKLPDSRLPDSEPGAKFADGWRKTVVLADQNADGVSSKCIAWVDQGWLIVERRDVSGDLEWQIVLAQVAEGDEPPEIEPNPNPKVPDGLRLSYRDGRFFIRDDIAHLRCLRQKKSASVKWPVLAIPENDRQPGGDTLDGVDRTYYMRIHHGWQFIACGLGGELAEYVLRMKHPDAEEIRGVSSSSGPGGVMHLRVIGPPEFAGRLDTLATVLDDSELLVVQRMREVDVERMRAARERAEKLEAQRKQLLGAAPPEISAREWLNSPRPVALGDLKGKVVLVYYWDDYSQAVARILTDLGTLYEKYRDGGLVIVGIQSPRGAEQLAKLVDQVGVKFPIAVDDGKTPERFGIAGSPSYFLIGRDGKIARSRYADPSTRLPPPGFAEIEKLLGAGAGSAK